MNTLLELLREPIPRGVPLRSVLTRDRLEAIQKCIVALAEGGNLAVGDGLKKAVGHGKLQLSVDMKGVRRYPVEPRFWPTLGQYETGYYFFTITDGCINERIPGAIAYATGKACKAIPPNTELEDEIEERKRFDITVGQQISVIVKVLDTGRVSEAEDAVTVVAEDERDEHDADGGVHYIPVAGSTYGVAGEYHYKLALLKPPVYGVKPAWLKMVLAGSHLSHWQDLPRFATPGGVAMSYDAADNKYSVRGNSVNGSITFKDCSNNVIKTVAWADGLITTAENITLIVPPCGGSSSS